MYSAGRVCSVRSGVSPRRAHLTESPSAWCRRAIFLLKGIFIMSDFELFQSMIDASKGNQNKDMTARFYDRSVKTERIDENGLPVFKDVCFVEIRVKDSYDVYDQPATEEKKQRFATEYSRYLVGKKQVENGSPLEQFAFLTAAEIDSLKYRGIFTVEALAELDEQKARDLHVEKERSLALKFLEKARGNSDIAAWQQKEEALKCELTVKDAQISRLKAELESLRKKANFRKEKSQSKH